MKAIQKTPIIDQVVQSIKLSIINGEFSVAQKLPSEMSLCQTLTVSRSTVREAFRVLQTMGYVELKPGRGAFVRNATPLDFESIRNWFRESAPKLQDFIEVRGAIESLAVRMAAERYTADEFCELESVSSDFKMAVERLDTPELARLDEKFHNCIVGMTKNTLLISINTLVAAEFKRYRAISFAVEANAQHATEPHRLILAALKDRDGERGALEMMKHLKLAVSDIESIIEE